ncbi:unnamed protein product [Rotaria sp. Silwood2]|nr:unnamed protein product [Rotaria sp. Silwood2]CAF4153689.1 unnamed protein product [Rotaria sp. Silwood2]
MTSERTETNHQHQSYRKLGTHALNKTDEHCRSLFNLLPTSLRPRHYYHHRQTSNKKGVDASTATQPSSSNDIIRTDYDSGYMSQSLLNRTSSYASCYSAVATIMPISSVTRHGSIESLLHGHSKSNPANIRIIVQKKFEPFAQAHIAVTKDTIVTALFSRGPWLYVRIDSNGKTGYIPRIICSLYDNQMITANNLSISSTDSSFSKDEEINIAKISSKNEKDFHYSYKQPINRYLSHSSAIINNNNNNTNQRIGQISFDERERRNTYTLPRPPRSNLSSSKDRRLTVSSINYPSLSNKQPSININNETATTSTTNNNNTIIATRDTDSSSTQDSGYSESTPFFLVQQPTPDNEQPPSHPIINTSKKPLSTPHYATVRRSAFLKIPDSINPSQPHQKQLHSTRNHRHTLLNGISMNDMINNDSSKRHTFGTFDRNNHKDISKENLNSKISTNNSVNRLRDFALIRNVRQDKSQSQQRIRPSIYNLPKSHIQIPASIFLNHHRQKQQFGSSHSAFRPVQPTTKHKRASSEGHSPSISTASSSSLSPLSSSNSSLNVEKHFSKRRRLSCDLPVPLLSKLNSNSLTRSVCDQSSSVKLNHFSRTMSDILCDQFSEINIDAIEKDSLIHHQPKKIQNSKHCLFTIIKDYRSSRASFSVQRGDCVYILKQIGQACYLVRKQTNGQIGFLPKTLLQPATSTRVDTFLETHGFRETVI